MLYLPHEIGLVGMAYHQEAGKVVLVVLDMVFQHLHAIEPGGIGMADGRPTLAAVAADVFGTPRGVLAFHCLDTGMVGEKVAALHQRHGVRVDLGHAGPVVVGQTADGMLDVQTVFAHDGSTRRAQQFIIMQQRAGYRVLNGEKANHGGVTSDILEYLFEGRAADDLQLFSFEILMCRYIMKRPDYSLYCYSLHSYLLFMQKSRSNRLEAGLLLC